MKPEQYKKLEEKLKKSDDVKIKTMKVYPVPQNQMTKEDADKIKEDWMSSRPSEKGSVALKELEFLTDAYPSIEITNLDMCNDMDETVDLTMKFNFYITKKKLFKLMALLHTVDMLWYDECFPVRIKMSCESDMSKLGFHWKKESGESTEDKK